MADLIMKENMKPLTTFYLEFRFAAGLSRTGSIHLPPGCVRSRRDSPPDCLSPLMRAGRPFGSPRNSKDG